MWVSSSARGRSPPIASSRLGSEDSGPGSTSISSTCQQQITCGRPRCMTSIGRIGGKLIPAPRTHFFPHSGTNCVRAGRGRGSGGRGGLVGLIGRQPAFGPQGVAQALLEAARVVAELLARLLVAGPEGHPVGGGDQLAQVR